MWRVTVAATLPLFASVAAGAAATPNSAPTVTATCGSGHWRLDGAALKADEGAAYSESWSPDIAAAAQCVRSLPTLCLEVQGHYDEAVFKEATIAAFGGVAAAQHARARGRATSVMAKLREQGVPDAQLKESLPLGTPTFRGATLYLRNDCVSGNVDARQMTTMVQEAAQQLLTADSSIVTQAVSKEIERIEAARPPPANPGVAPTAESPLHIWGDGGVAAGVLAFPNSDATDHSGDLLIWVGGGMAYRHAYVRAQVGAVVGTAEQQRLGLDGALAIGYALDFWQVGLRASLRSSSYRLSEPKLDQSWDLGAEGSQCLWRLGPWTLCAYEYIAPAGNLRREGEVSHGRVERIPNRTSYLTRLDVGLSIRYAADTVSVLFP